MRLFDSHCHLDLEHFKDDTDQVIKRAREAGVKNMIIPAVELSGFDRVYEIAKNNDGVYCAIGVHPNDAEEWNDASRSVIEKYLETDKQVGKIIAIGEIGLDNYWKTVSMDTQVMVLKEQLSIASDHDLPVIIHAREENNDRQGRCSEELVRIFSSWVAGLSEDSKLKNAPGVFHSFSGDVELAQKLFDLGFYFGFTGPITYKTAEINREVVKFLPDHRLLIETDSPYLSPVPYRGKRNEPAFVAQVALKIAEILNEKPEKIAELTTNNARKLFFGEVID